MPRTPSGRILKNRCSIYKVLSGPDAEGGAQWQYGTPVAQNIPCSVQYIATEEIYADDGQSRIGVRNVYKIIFGQAQNYAPRTQILQTDITPNRELLVMASPPSEAGREQAWVIRAEEKV